jgi:predicted nucleic acid-binding protein
VILVDTCGWIEYIRGGRNAEHYAPALEDPANLVVPSLCIQELTRHVLSHSGLEAARAVAAMTRKGRVIPHGPDLAVFAAELGWIHKLALADAIIYATALTQKAELWTQDGAFRGLAGVRIFDKG